MMDNPLLAAEGLPRYDAILPEHIEPGVTRLLELAEEQLTKIEQSGDHTWAGLMEPLAEMDSLFEYGWSPISHLLGVKNSEALREAHEKMLAPVVTFSLRASQSKPIYEALKGLRDSDEPLDEAQRRAVDIRLRNAEHAGVGLEGDAQTRFNEIANELSRLSTDFSNHVLDATKAFELIITSPDDATGWPSNLRQLAAQSYNQTKGEDAADATPENGPWRITLDLPVYIPFMEHSQNASQREQLYRARIRRAADGDLNNDALIEKILKLRKEQVALLGFDNYAQYSLASKMAPSAAAVNTMFDELQTASRVHAEKDFAELQELAKANGAAEDLKHWDIGFWAERLREQKFDYTDEQLRPYFPMPRVLEGLFSLTQKLFGVTITASDGDAPIWHKDVRTFLVQDADGEHIASFYLDPYSRPEEKRGGAWMDGCVGRRKTEKGVRLPVVHLVCNGTPPVGDRPSLMSFDEVVTLFHEFGHGLQGMLTTVDYADVSGLSGIEWDAVEICSQFMENWCYHKPTLVGMTQHVETGESLPDDLFDKICAARTFRAGSQFLRQLEFGMTDMLLHSDYEYSAEHPPHKVRQAVAEKTSVLPPLEEDRMLNSFSHIFAGGYAAGYYSYKWSEVLSADAFAAFEEAGLDNDAALAELGAKFRDTLLALGGGRHPMDVYRDFRGRDATTEALLRHNGLAT